MNYYFCGIPCLCMQRWTRSLFFFTCDECRTNYSEDNRHFTQSVCRYQSRSLRIWCAFWLEEPWIFFFFRFLCVRERGINQSLHASAGVIEWFSFSPFWILLSIFFRVKWLRPDDFDSGFWFVLGELHMYCNPLKT